MHGATEALDQPKLPFGLSHPRGGPPEGEGSNSIGLAVHHACYSYILLSTISIIVIVVVAIIIVIVSYLYIHVKGLLVVIYAGISHGTLRTQQLPSHVRDKHVGVLSSSQRLRHCSRIAGLSLRRLVLNQNPLGDKGLLRLVAGCPKGQRVALTELGLEGCGLGCLCAQPLAAILQDWTSLQQLTLSWNNLGIRGKQSKC